MKKVNVVIKADECLDGIIVENIWEWDPKEGQVYDVNIENNGVDGKSVIKIECDDCLAEEITNYFGGLWDTEGEDGKVDSIETVETEKSKTEKRFELLVKKFEADKAKFNKSGKEDTLLELMITEAENRMAMFRSGEHKESWDVDKFELVVMKIGYKLR